MRYRLLGLGVVVVALILGGMTAPREVGAEPQLVGIDFDDVDAGAPGTAYRARGMTFEQGTVEEGEARSEPHLLATRCGDDVGCTPPRITMRFDRNVAMVRLWVRAEFGATPATVQLVGVQRDRRSVSDDVAVNDAGYRPIEVRSEAGNLGAVTLNWAQEETRGLFVDDIEFEPALAELRLSPDEVDFGTVDTGERATEIVRVTNTGNLPATPEAELGSTRSPFTVQDDGCAKRTLAPEEFCTVTIAFAPAERGAVEAQLAVGGTTVPLRGTGRLPVGGTTPPRGDEGSDPSTPGDRSPTSETTESSTRATTGSTIEVPTGDDGGPPLGVLVALGAGFLGVVAGFLWWRRRRPSVRPPAPATPRAPKPPTPPASVVVTLRTDAAEVDGGAEVEPGLPAVTVRFAPRPTAPDRPTSPSRRGAAWP